MTPQVIWKEREHKADCYAVEQVAAGVWDSPWAIMPTSPGYVFYGDRLGRTNGTTTSWLIVVCNDTSCPARALVNFAVIEGAVTSVLGEEQ